MKRIALIAIALCMFVSLSARRQNTTRTGLKPIGETQSAAPALDTVRADSLVVLSGYEKTLRSSSESLLITNLSADTILEVGVTITYLDTRGRLLHKRQVAIPTEVPPTETRMASFPSWDKQKVWYYTLSAPARTSAPATPYDVSISTDYILLPPK